MEGPPVPKLPKKEFKYIPVPKLSKEEFK